MKTFKKFLSYRSLPIVIIFSAVVIYSIYSYNSSPTEKIKTVISKNDSFDIKFNSQMDLLYGMNHGKIDSVVAYSSDSTWYPASNMYCNKTCHTLVHIKIKIKT